LVEYPFQDKEIPQWSDNDYADFWYYEIGVNPIPYNGVQKNTWVQWTNHPKGDFQQVSISLEIFESWKKAGSFSKGIAVICGKVFRGEHKDKWLNGIDFDNKIALDTFYPHTVLEGEKKKTLDEYAQNNLIEQHDNKEKCHIYFYTDKPILFKAANPDHYDGEDEKVPTRPQIEIKSNGTALTCCTPSPHKDGSKIRILGTRVIQTIDADALENNINEICVKYDIPYLSKKNQGKILSSVQSIINSKRKMYEGEYRRLPLLQYLDSKKIKNPELNEEALYQIAIQFGLEHFGDQYPDSKMRSIVDDAMKFGEEINENKEKQNESKEEKITSLVQLNDITDPKYAGELVKVKVIVSSNLIPYNIPYKIESFCVNYSDKHECPNDKTHAIIPEKDMSAFVDMNGVTRKKALHYFTGVSWDKECSVVVIETETITINRMKIRPIMNSIISDGEGGFTDDDDNKYSSFDIYLIQRDFDIKLTAGKEIEVTGYVIPDAKNSKVTMMITLIEELNENEYDITKIKEIQEFHKGKNSEFIMNWFTVQFEKFSKVVKREDITTLVLLTMFSSLGFKFEEKEITGWINSIIMGDTTTAKSETAKQLIILLKAGLIVSGEMATLAGIAGGAAQITGGSWFIDFGVLPLQDKKALFIDGAHKLGKKEIDKLAEAERNGKIEIVKIAKASAWARTRQCKIMNPIDDDINDVIAMNNFIHPVRAVNNSFQLQSIARIDLAIFVSDNVKSKDRNVKMTKKHNPLLENYSDVLKLIWSRRCTVKFDDDVIDKILNGADILEEKFKTDEIPLITNNQKYKLAKLSASIAGFTCSFNDDFTEIIVKKEHVDYIVNFITKIYTASGLGKIAKKGMYGEIDIKVLHDVIWKINDRINKDDYETAVNIIKWIGEQRKITKEDLMGEFSLSRDKQTVPLLAYLVNENIIKRTKTGSTVTNKGVSLTKFIINLGNSVYQDLEDFHNDLFKSYECTGCNSDWNHTRDSIEKLQEEHGGCIGSGKIIEIVK